MEILKLIHAFRNALLTTIEFESFKVCRLNGWQELNSFPHGSCDITSNFLGQFLNEHGFPVDVIYCNGTLENLPGLTSHVWLEVNDQYVDLTAHQFVNFETRRIIYASKKEPCWLRDYFLHCKRSNNANVNPVNINSPFENRHDLYTYISNLASSLLIETPNHCT